VNLTLVEGLRELQGVDELRIETRGHLNTHAAHEQEEVKVSKVWLPVPWHLVLLHEARNDGVGCVSGVHHDVEIVGTIVSRATRWRSKAHGTDPWVL